MLSQTRFAARALVRANPLQAVASRPFADKFKDRESAQESVFFNN